MSEANALVPTPQGDPPIPEELRSAWMRVEAHRHAPNIERGLRLVACGWSLHAASAEADADRTSLRKYAARYGIATQSARIVGGQRRIALMAQDLVEQKLEDGNVDVTQASILAGIAIDKIAKYEGWGKPEPPPPSNYSSAIAELTHALQAGESLTITVTKQAADPVEQAIDVTPG